jgi:hypothetical protein
MGTVTAPGHGARPPVAVKVLRARLADDPAFVDRLSARRARRASTPEPRTSTSSARGRLAVFRDGVRTGRDVRAEIAVHGPMPFAKFVDVIVQAARGLRRPAASTSSTATSSRRT